MNVFDIVDEFYTQDPEWNTVIDRRHVDGYLRTLAWKGVGDDELIDIWSDIMLLCVFLGNSENFLGDMNRENFIDCVGWCGRNVAGFSINVTHVQQYLKHLQDFYQYLHKKKVVFQVTGPQEALAKLVVNDKLQLLDRHGNFLSDIEKYNLYSSPDLPAKIFLNVAEKMDNLLEAIRNFYAAKEYYRDVERAAFLYSGILSSGVIDEKPESEEYAQAFWDYFLFDYHLLSNDKRPIQHFYDDMCANNFTVEGEAYEDILLELIKTRLVVFSVKGRNEDNTFSCVDVFSHEAYSLVLPLEEESEIEGMLFMGHIYYNETMVINFVRGFKINATAEKRMVQTMKRAKNWFAWRNGGKLSWSEFIERNAMFVRHICLIYSAYIRLDCFSCETKVEAYEPASIVEDKVTLTIASMLKPYSFSCYDIRICQRMWSDFVKVTGKSVRMPEIWAAGIIRNFIELNSVYNYDLQKISEMCRNVPTAAISRTSNEVLNTLALEPGDPRYVNEEGLLLLLLS